MSRANSGRVALAMAKGSSQMYFCVLMDTDINCHLDSSVDLIIICRSMYQVITGALSASQLARRLKGHKLNAAIWTQVKLIHSVAFTIIAKLCIGSGYGSMVLSPRLVQ